MNRLTDEGLEGFIKFTSFLDEVFVGLPYEYNRILGMNIAYHLATLINLEDVDEAIKKLQFAKTMTELRIKEDMDKKLTLKEIPIVEQVLIKKHPIKKPDKFNWETNILLNNNHTMTFYMPTFKDALEELSLNIDHDFKDM